jgi:hypothetical protein
VDTEGLACEYVCQHHFQIGRTVTEVGRSWPNEHMDGDGDTLQNLSREACMIATVTKQQSYADHTNTHTPIYQHII